MRFTVCHVKYSTCLESAICCRCSISVYLLDEYRDVSFSTPSPANNRETKRFSWSLEKGRLRISKILQHYSQQTNSIHN